MGQPHPTPTMTPQTTPGFLKYPNTCRASFVSGDAVTAVWHICSHLLLHILINWNVPVWQCLVWEPSLFFGVAITYVHNNNNNNDEGFIKR